MDALVETLNEATEIAIDLEHHDYRSYLGFTCLVQISINGYDFIIDPLCVGHCLHKLLAPFTNPNIIKVGIHVYTSPLCLFALGDLRMFCNHIRQRNLYNPELYRSDIISVHN